MNIHFDQISLGGFSDHDLLFYACNFNITQPVAENVYFRHFNAINNYELYIECLKVNWNECWFFADVNDKLESLNSNVLKLFNKHVPLKRLKLHSRRPPWYKLDVHRCINERNKLYKKWKSNTSAANWELFRIARNKVHVVVKCDY